MYTVQYLIYFISYLYSLYIAQPPRKEIIVRYTNNIKRIIISYFILYIILYYIILYYIILYHIILYYIILYYIILSSR
jgi:hypothetical protein